MKEFIVEPDYENCRLDRFLREKFYFHQGLICKAIRNKDILLNNAKTKEGEKLKNGDKISIYEKFVVNTPSKPEREISAFYLEKIKKAVIHQDENILVLNKPYGICVQGGDGVDVCIIDILQEIFGTEIRIVHRVDKNTSGVMLFARNKKTAASLAESFRDCKVEKEYLAILDGVPRDSSGQITTRTSTIYLKDHNGSKAVLDDNGDLGISDYKVLSSNAQEIKSLVLFLPKTGRMHQIRIHARELGTPIMGDEKYNNKSIKGEKLQLIARKITIPGFGSFEIPKLPEHFTKIMQSCNLTCEE